MRKFIVGLLMAATTIVCVAAPAAAKDFTIGLSWNAYDSILVHKWEDYLQAQGREQGKAADINIKWVINVANADPTRQAANIEDLINQGVDLILARAEDGAAIGSSIKAAEAAGIPFVTFDRASSTEKPTAHVGGDSYDQGKTTAEAMVALLKEKGVQGKCIELEGNLTDENAVFRHNAWHEVTDKSGVIETVVEVPTEWNPELFRSGTANALRAHPEANCMFLASDFCWSAVQSPLEAAGKYAKTGDPKHVWIATQDVFPDAAKAMEDGYIDVGTTYDAFYHAKEAIRVAILIAQKKPVECGPHGCLAKGRLATQATIDKLENLWSLPTK